MATKSHARHIALVLSVAALTAAGCGSSNKKLSDVDQVKAAYHAYVTGLGSLNGASVCAAMTPKLATQYVSTVTISPAAASLKGKGCAQIMQYALSHASPQFRAAIDAVAHSEPSKIQISGNSASYTVHVSALGQTLNIPGKAQKMGGTWKISCCLGTGGGG